MLRKRIWKPLAGAIFFLTLLAAFFFCRALIKLDVLPTNYMFIILGAVALLLAAGALLLYAGINKKPSAGRRVRRIAGGALCGVLILGCGIAGYAISKLDKTKEDVAKAEYDVKAVVGVYVPKDDPAQTLSDAAGYTIGVLSGYEESNSLYALGEIGKIKGSAADSRNYADITAAAAALRSGEVRALAVNTSYLALLQDSEEFNSFSSEIRLIESINIPVDSGDGSGGGSGSESGTIERPWKSDEDISDIIEKESMFIIYLSGNDARGTTLAKGRSDVNILMAVNPNTKQILLISTPRDYYIENPALGGAMDKLSHCGLFGAENSAAALENLYKSPVSGYFQINFTGFEKVVDAIGGIELDNPTAFSTTKGVYFEKGKISLDGEHALAYARERHAFGDGDLSRGRNQIRVIKAMISKLKSSGASLLKNYSDILDSLSGMFITDLSSQQISQIAKLAVSHLSDWDVKSCTVSFSSTGMMSTASGGAAPVYIMWPDLKQIQLVTDTLTRMQADEIITDEDIASIAG